MAIDSGNFIILKAEAGRLTVGTQLGLHSKSLPPNKWFREQSTSAERFFFGGGVVLVSVFFLMAFGFACLFVETRSQKPRMTLTS